MPDTVPSTANGIVPSLQPNRRTQNAGSMEEPIPKFHHIIPGPSKLGEGEYTRWKGYFKTFQENFPPGMKCF